MLWVPTFSVEIERVATPLAFTDEDPRFVVPSRKLTLPVGGTVPLQLSAAVKVTD